MGQRSAGSNWHQPTPLTLNDCVGPQHGVAAKPIAYGLWRDAQPAPPRTPPPAARRTHAAACAAVSASQVSRSPGGTFESGLCIRLMIGCTATDAIGTMQ